VYCLLHIADDMRAGSPPLPVGQGQLADPTVPILVALLERASYTGSLPPQLGLEQVTCPITGCLRGRVVAVGGTFKGATARNRVHRRAPGPRAARACSS